MPLIPGYSGGTDQIIPKGQAGGSPLTEATVVVTSSRSIVFPPWATRIEFQCWAGGGSGAGGATAVGAAAGGGGAGGGYVAGSATAPLVNPGDTLNVFGSATGAAGGAVASDGESGNSAAIYNGVTPIVVCPGGGAGLADGTGGAASTNTVDPGVTGVTNTQGSAGVASVAGTAGGAGGAGAGPGGGAGGAGGVVNNGAPGVVRGGGGGGGRDVTTTGSTGGAGTPPLTVIRFFA